MGLSASPPECTCTPDFFLALTYIRTELRAQPSKYEGKRVLSIRFEPDEKPLVEEELSKAIQSLKVGEPLRMQNVREAIEQLFASGRYEDLAVEASESADGVLLTFRVTHARFVRNIVVTGLDEPPSSGQLVTATKLQLGERFDLPQVRHSVESLLETLRANGFYLAKITPDVVDQPFQQVDVNFRVESGDRAKYTTPIVKGTPNRTVDQIVGASRWKRFSGLLGWKEVTETRTNQGLDRIRRKLYQKRDFLMARILLEQMEYRPQDNRVVPTLNIESGGRVVVRARGAKISGGRLRELVPVFQELTVDKDLLVEGQREITEYMQSRGFFQAEVDFEQSTNDQGETVIEYSIAPGERHKIVEVIISGNKYFDTNTLRERMYIQPASFLRYRRGRFSQDFLRRDANALRSLYQTNGFRDVEVRARTEVDYKGPNNIGVFFEIEEGAQWFVSDLDIEGVDTVQVQDLRALLQSTEGQPYSELSIATDQDTILGYFFNNGYPDATLDVVAERASAPQQMTIKYVIRSGERQFVRDVLISGLGGTDPDLVKERIQLAPGDPLSQSEQIASQRRLYDLGIFARVDTALQNPDGDTDHKYVLYRFEEARKYSVTAGFGAQIAKIGGSSNILDTPAGTSGFSPRLSLGVSRSNFLGVGHTIGIQTRWSNIQRRALLTYLAPQFKGNDRLNLTITGLYDDSRDVLTFNSRRQEGSVQLSQRVTKANTVQYRTSYRRVTVSNLNITPALIPLFNQPVQLVAVATTFLQDRRDDPVDARRGLYNTLDLALASDFWGDPKSTFTRALGRNATYHRVGREMVFARQTSFGFMNRLKAGDVPLPERFFAGGATSHRGFSENQAGPRDLLTGFPIGGKALLMNNHEVRFPLIGDNIAGVLFHDAGNVYSDLGNVSFRVTQRDLEDFDYMVHAVGFGIRYRTPIGPVRVDFAFGFNTPRFLGLKGTREQLLDPNLIGVEIVEQRISRFQFHFSLGQLF